MLLVIARDPGAHPGTARARMGCIHRAVEKLAHLPQGETFIFSYAEMPEEAIQRAMAREHFRAGSPIREVRFGSATWRKPAHHPGEQAP